MTAARRSSRAATAAAVRALRPLTVDVAEPDCGGNVGRSRRDKVYGGPGPDVIAIQVLRATRPEYSRVALSPEVGLLLALQSTAMQLPKRGATGTE
jgi:hypothetical protein